MADFASKFSAIEEFVKGATSGLMGKLDAMTFKMLINNLKSNDYYVVSDTLQQLAREKRLVSIPPVYYVWSQHPDARIREEARKALESLDQKKEVEKLTKDKSIEEAIKALIMHYGNFRQ